MRIAFIGQKGFPATWGGIEVHVDALARRLVARGHEVTVFNRTWYGGRSDASANGGVIVVNTPTLARRSLDALAHSFTSTLAALAGGIDVIHYHAFGPTLLAPVPWLARRTVVATIHGYDYRAARWGLAARSILRAGEWTALHVPQRTVVVARHMHEHYQSLGHRTHCIPNGVDPVPAVEALEIHRFALEPRGFLLFSARIEANKGAHLLLEAFSRFKAAHPESSVKLVVAGPLVSRDPYVETLSGHASKDVVFVGEARGRLKAELLTNALGFVTPSAFEGLPIAVLEAMSAGVPVLASDIPAHRELLAEGAGLLCDLGDPNGLTAGLTSLLSLDGGEREKLVATARALARRYTWDTNAAELERVYDDALSSRTR